MPKARKHDATSPPLHHVRQLLEFVTSPEVVSLDLAKRRLQTLAAVLKFLDAEAGLWSWGRGHPDDDSVVPVAYIESGITPSQMATVAELSLNRDGDHDFRLPMLPWFDGEGQATVTRRDIISDSDWKRDSTMRRITQFLNMESWMHTVRYVRSDTWCNIFCFRRVGRPEFGIDERSLLNLAMSSIQWLHPTSLESLSRAAFTGLTPRQKTVLLLLLDGKSRQSVAKQLGVTEHTVGDHIKALYKHFGIHSLTELVAQLLKSG